MKKIILLMLMFSPFADADMDTVCYIDVPLFVPLEKQDVEYVEKRIKEYECERNNILELEADRFGVSTTESIDLRKKNLKKLSNLFCRFDRNRLITKAGLSCVLYSTKARKYKNEYLGFKEYRD
tara:strand:+ start:70 stop:441 length:372 start_codon:yes stop_codon:yes gene_type:complete